MANKTLVQKIEVLEDGKLKATVLTSTIPMVVYLQPVIVVDNLDKNEEVHVRGKNGNLVLCDSTIESIDGVPFVGDYTALQTALRTMAKTANGLLVGGAGGGGGGPVDATIVGDSVGLNKEATQLLNLAENEEANTYLIKKDIGSILDLSADDGGEWGGFPFDFQGSMAVIININGVQNEFPSTETITKIEDLVEELNNIQSLLVFGKIDATNLLMNDGTANIDDVTSIVLDTSVEEFTYSAPYTETTDVPLSNLDEINERQKQIYAYIKSISDGQIANVTVGTMTTEQLYDASVELNSAVTILAANPNRHSAYVYIDGKDAFIRPLEAATTPAERKGHYTTRKFTRSFTSGFGDDVYKGELSLINTKDGDDVNYFVIEYIK